MIKGSQKQLIVLRTGNSRYFDEAYFVLRRELQSGKCDRSDILLEANRILRESAPEPRGSKRKSMRAWICFLGGILCGGVLCTLLFLLL